MSDIPPPFDSAWFLFLVGFIFGSVLGSFATMLAYRLPRHLSIIAPGSACPSCHAPLKIYDLIPIFSWIVSRGRCRHCHAQIGKQYVMIELATSVGCGIATTSLGVTVYLPIAYAIIVVLVVMAAHLAKRASKKKKIE